MPDGSLLLDASGAPIPRAVTPRPQASTYGINTLPWDRRSSLWPYTAADIASQELAGWLPIVRGPDAEINLHRDRVVGRSRDLVRNNGWATGGVTRTTDNAIGAHFRPMPKPNFLALRRTCPACDAQWADELASAIKAEWAAWADDPAHFCDAQRRMTMTQLFRLALRHKLIDGEGIGILLYQPELIEQGATYATALQLVDPDRLSNPYEERDTDTLRGGVEIDQRGAPLAYHFRRAEQNDWFQAAESMIWDRVARFTSWGRPVVIHDLDIERVDQHRGLGVLTPVIDRFRMLTRYDAAELQQAVLQAVIRTFIVSPNDVDGLNLLGAEASPVLQGYQDMRMEFADAHPVELGGVRVPRLFPGENIANVQGAGPGAHYPDFEHTVLRSISAAIGTSPEQLTQDWSRTSYSSVRASLLEAGKTLSRRRGDFAANFAAPVYAAWLEEALDPVDGQLRSLMPKGAPDFLEARAAYARCRWIGPARGWVDPVKERQGAVLGLDAGFSTLEQECAEQGLEWEEVVQQRAIEVAKFHELKLPLPDWNGAEPAEQTEQKPVPA